MADGDPLRALGAVGLAALAAYAALLAVKFVRSRRHALAHPEDGRAAGAVTVLQPILSGDPSLEEALRRNLDGPAGAGLRGSVRRPASGGGVSAGRVCGHPRGLTHVADRP